ncbi:hypothetical protein MVEN_01432000 [Mycena venus]|uniref:Uncharacterized protein n=1 Tax=Mycena venus TaxID=2733690 RepID=A0A8H6XZA7_9AGAR|nr:hypothetical protein MVEN_01432000 [Mycena venus]
MYKRPPKRSPISPPTSKPILHNTITPTFTLKPCTGGSDSNFTIYPKQNETWGQNHWGRGGAETITITWAGGKSKSFTIQKNDRVLVWDDAYGVESNVITTQV